MEHVSGHGNSFETRGLRSARPGGGKSTLLRHYQLSQAQYLSDAQRLVFYVQLRDYRPDKLTDDPDPGIDNPAMRWLEAQWRKETRTAPPLFKFIRQGRLTLLLDGLNEIPRRSDEEYRARVAEWRDLFATIEQGHPGVRLLLSRMGHGMPWRPAVLFPTGSA